MPVNPRHLPPLPAGPEPARRFRARHLPKALLGFACLFVLVGLVFFLHCASGPAAAPKPQSAAAAQRRNVTLVYAGYARPEVDTYLSYPEWYIVWSYQERADFQQHELPTNYPFFSSIGQYWAGYCCVYGFTRGRYPFNAGEHIMLGVIGSSFSFEYLVRGIYETTVGRLTGWLTSHRPSEEDRFAYTVARRYADFVHIRPFYEFSFWNQFKELWHDTPLWGAYPLRKWERRAFLSLDYSLEAFYCWIIEQITHSTYGYESADTYAWIENAPDDVFAAIPRLRKVRQVGPAAFVVVIPRYQEFTAVASQLARRNVRFVEIAGNEEILLTAIAPLGWSSGSPDARALFAAPVLTRPNFQRVGLRAPVASLSSLLNRLSASGIAVEHIYDF